MTRIALQDVIRAPTLHLAERPTAVAAGAAIAIVLAIALIVVAAQLAPAPHRGVPLGAAAVATRRSVTSTSPGSTPAPGTTLAPSPSPLSSPSPGGSAAPIPGTAPATATGFSLTKAVVLMRFPLKSGTTYSYEDNFLVHRVGVPLSYNHVWVAPGGTILHRAHDGVDIYVPLRTTLLSPFDGVVIDPSKRWRPWRRDRYGLTAVIQSTEVTSLGYVAVLAHLSTVGVKVGDQVRRGDVIGRSGRTGNAEETRTHVHFELRAPFRIAVRVAGRIRPVDAFDPFRSLVAADPRRASSTPRP